MARVSEASLGDATGRGVISRLIVAARTLGHLSEAEWSWPWSETAVSAVGGRAEVQLAAYAF